ncbi:hypothetical protein AVEN_225452-1 [Araneus ventricosus]|uniref:Uncharacterized protein n=1 Tax=Araneus ventricosus TaxID=182803 RepID=A0A4Y2UCV4_ARAVE|nr:hypothetical protein AVEN_225452-1 [Araneus ventricosus]
MKNIDSEENPIDNKENIDIEKNPARNMECIDTEENPVSFTENIDTEENPVSFMENTDIGMNPVFDMENIDFEENSVSNMESIDIEDNRDSEGISEMISFLSHQKENFTFLLELLGGSLGLYESTFIFLILFENIGYVQTNQFSCILNVVCWKSMCSWEP